MNLVMNSELRPFLLFFIFLIPAASAQIDCLNGGNYTRNSPYAANLNSTLSSLYNNIDDNGFSNASAGDGTDRANAAVLCRGDLQLNECRDCVQKASTELLQSCPNQKQAVGTFDKFCLLRYSNDTIYRTPATQPFYSLVNTQNVTSPERFMVALRSLIDDLRSRAASGGSLRKVAAGSTTGPDFQSIYGMVHSTPDLSPNDCTNCLITAATELPRCCNGRRGARVLTPSCVLRYEDLSFYNETRLQELERFSVAVPLFQSQPPPGKGRTAVIVAVSVVSGMILAVFGFILLRRRRWRKHRLIEETDHENEEAGEEISTAESLQYAFSTIKAATNNFSESNKLGQGGFGTVYKGKLENGKEIAVKRLSQNSVQGDLEFKNEVMLLVKLQHRNLVRLMGFALQGKEKLLIYEFVENASLDLFIFGSSRNSYLDWDRRYKIIAGIARGILYLHEDSRLRIVHRDLKAGNILLDGDMNPKIADFGMARLFMQDETQGNTSRIVGTYGYMPPEYLMQGQFSTKSDVFSFGVLLLEIISGQKNNNFRDGEKTEDLLSAAWENWRAGSAVNVVDPMLTSGSGGSGSIKDMVRCIHIGLLCVQENAADRPTMASVVLMLSSSSMTLAVPSEPAFYFRSGFSRLQEENSGDVVSGGSSKGGDHSSHTNTELYPR